MATPDKDSFITLHRKITQWEWYTDANTTRVFLHLLLLANHKETRWRGEVIERGQVLTGRHQLSRELRISERGIRTALDHLKTTNEVTIRATNHFSIITISNYCEYQDKKDRKRPAERPAERQSSDQQPTTSNNVNNDNNKTLSYEREVIPPDKHELADFFQRGGSTVDEAASFWRHYTSNGWMVGRVKMKSWTASAGNWIRKSKTEYRNGKQQQRRNGRLEHQRPISPEDLPGLMQSIADDPRYA